MFFIVKNGLSTQIIVSTRTNTVQTSRNWGIHKRCTGQCERHLMGAIPENFRAIILQTTTESTEDAVTSLQMFNLEYNKQSILWITLKRNEYT